VIYPGSPYSQSVEQSGITCLTPIQLKGQELEIRAGLNLLSQSKKPYLSHYELEAFVY
jgi:hypothetical protein